MYHFPNHHLYHQNTYQQQCPMFVEHTKHSTVTTGTTNVHNNSFADQHDLTSVQPEALAIQATEQNQNSTPNVENKNKVRNKSNIDTSSFSIEERLVAAVWVHERKNTKSSMSQIKQDFFRRFGRQPPAKNTLLVWERKLFSTGSVHDAPRPGRPINRRARMDEVAASVRAAPALSLRARALALRLPRTTLRTILRTDLSQATSKHIDPGRAIQTGKHQSKRSVKTHAKRKLDLPADHGIQCSNETIILNGFNC